MKQPKPLPKNVLKACMTCTAFDRGTCRRNPPALVMRPDGTPARLFVPVDDKDWCLMWELSPIHG